MFEVIASCFIKSIGTNVLYVKYTSNINISSWYIIIACINDTFYNLVLIGYPKYSAFAKHAIENGLISIQDEESCSEYTFIIINGRRDCLQRRSASDIIDKEIEEFATENKHLFEYDGRPILK